MIHLQWYTWDANIPEEVGSRLMQAALPSDRPGSHQAPHPYVPIASPVPDPIGSTGATLRRDRALRDLRHAAPTGARRTHPCAPAK